MMDEELARLHTHRNNISRSRQPFGSRAPIHSQAPKK
jgi:hypothetical protein